MPSQALSGTLVTSLRVCQIGMKVSLAEPRNRHFFENAGTVERFVFDELLSASARWDVQDEEASDVLGTVIALLRPGEENYGVPLFQVFAVHRKQLGPLRRHIRFIDTIDAPKHGVSFDQSVNAVDLAYSFESRTITRL
jgi:hypothetical protein